MFIQVIQAHTDSAAEVKRVLDRWTAEAGPGAPGWLGTTAGITEDGTMIALARFESPESARANSGRPEQDAWWKELSSLFTGEATFHDCSDVVLMGVGGSDTAGFVQVMQGRVADRERHTASWSEMEALLADERPELLGSVLAFHDSGDGFTEAAYFTTEAEARAGEAKEPSEEARKLWEREREVYADVTYIDLREPWLSSP